MKNFIKSVLIDLIVILVIINSVYSYFLSSKLYSRIFNITSSSFIVALGNLNKELNDIYNKDKPPAEDFLDLYNSLTPMREVINHSLNLFLSKNIIHIFMITKKNNHFVYVYNAKEYVIPGFPFMPDKSELNNILKAYKSDKLIIYKHTKMFNMGFSLYYPIDIANKYRALVVLDYSNEFTDIIDENFYIQRYISFSLLLLSLFFLLYVAYTKLDERVKKIALAIDPLTGVFNRRRLKFMEDIHNNYIIAMADIDYFKSINDTYGHTVGDMVLKLVADILKQSLRNEDIIIRYGGEEFLIFIKDSNNDLCELVLNRIRENVEKSYIHTDDIEIKITLSIGALLNGKDLPLEERIKIADKFLYEAKNSGRNKVICGKA